MIVVHLLGGLGNQMFQYAAGRRLAAIHQVPLALEISGFANYPLRRYELDAFAIEPRFVSLPEVESWVRQRAQAGVAVAFLQEPHFHFHAPVREAPADAFLDGYWQSERYFADIAPQLRQDFTLRAPLDPINAERLAQIQGCAAISVHVRRTDYVTNPRTHAVHGTCGVDYYQRGIAHLMTRVGSPRFFVFTDDPGWARENVVPLIPATAVVVEGNAGSGAIDLTLMRACRHHLVANSSFSWWGAWLCSHPEKIVVAPERWFADGGKDTRDLIPAGWARL